MWRFPIFIITLLILCIHALPILNNMSSMNTSLLYPNLFRARQCFDFRIFKSRRAKLGDQDPFGLPCTEIYMLLGED